MILRNWLFPFALVGYPFVAPLKELYNSVNTSFRLNHGQWVEHRGHGITKWLSYLPDSFSSTGQSELYLFEMNDVCRCAAATSSRSQLDVYFLGGDPTRHVQLSLHQLFTDHPFEIHEDPIECDNVYSSAESMCGLIVKNPLQGTFCNGTLNTYSINFDRHSRPPLIRDVMVSKAKESFRNSVDVLFIIDPQRSGLIAYEEFSNILANVSSLRPKGSSFLALIHNAQDVEDATVESDVSNFLSNKIPFLNYYGVFANFTAKYSKQNVHDMNAYRGLFLQMLLNTVCDISPEQSMLFGSKVGSFQLKEKKIYEEGSLMRPGNSREIFLMSNGSLHAFPNWDTFVAGGYESRNVRPVPPIEWSDIPMGKPLDPCTKC
jgi:hypothetical protein